MQGISNWPKLMKEAYRSTRPGGYVELCETGAEIFSDDGTMRDDSPIKRYFELITTTMTSIGRPTAKFDCLVKRLRDAGFVDIQGHTLKEPMGPWPRETNLKQAGMMMLLQCDTGRFWGGGLGWALLMLV